MCGRTNVPVPIKRTNGALDFGRSQPFSFYLKNIWLGVFFLFALIIIVKSTERKHDHFFLLSVCRHKEKGEAFEKLPLSFFCMNWKRFIFDKILSLPQLK